ncbi:Protein RTM1 [Lasiodiplodia hormozganensis]|uniref:Protein RTM1 n=1 Tax=Lasiodiplodia hormozganensis TaxID=869390 RepID=A0AA39XRV8_9PEZI|nr:Protein RTM1 [Lasiodiplodia hormozganensis]
MASYGYYRYQPNTAAAGIFAVLFAIPTFYHCFQCFRTRTWYFIPLIVGGFFETIGYVARAISSTKVDDLGSYIVQMLTILIAPSLFAASMYMLLGRLMQVAGGERHALIPRRFLTKVFVVGDVVAFLLQCGGGGIVAAAIFDTSGARDTDKMKLGEKVIEAGLFVQLIFFGFFLVIGSWWKRGIEKDIEPAPGSNNSSSEPGVAWRKHFWVLMGASSLVFLRCVFRVVEYMSGRGAEFQNQEWFVYVFDAVLMLGVVVLFNVVHPSEVTRMLKQEDAGARGTELA